MPSIPRRAWNTYIEKLAKVNKAAADRMREWIQINGVSDMDACIEYAYSLSTAYGEAAATLACQMYDAVGLASDMILEAAVPAEVASYGEVAKTVYGTAKSSQNVEEMASAIGRLVKRTGQDTTLKNALRDGAQFAWIPSGDTCAFCITLASRGWQYASKNTIKNGHAEHIHSNCDCTYAVRFGPDLNVEGYDPQKYLDMYENADGNTPQARINALRREFYNENKEIINEQKRSAYAKRIERNSSAAEELNVD